MLINLAYKPISCSPPHPTYSAARSHLLKLSKAFLFAANGSFSQSGLTSLLGHADLARALGYGLYLIKKMMEVYGWTIQEVGEPRKGAVFTIKMPKVK